MMLPGFYISNFRNFGDNEQFVGPLGKMNIFIGPNNSGKSNILRYIRDILSHLYANDRSAPRALQISKPRFAVNERSTHNVLLQCDLASIEPMLRSPIRPGVNWISLFENHGNSTGDGVHIKVEVSPDGNGQFRVVGNSLSPDGIDHRLLQELWSNITGQGAGGFQLWHTELFDNILHRQLKSIDALYISSFIQIGTRIDEFRQEYSDAPGSEHLIDELAELESPSWDQQDKKSRFEKLRRFIGEVIDRPNIQINIPSDRKTINVNADGNVVPLEALGSGIHELFMLAARIIINENRTILLEEPEVHMHPDLQKKFINFLAREINGQFFITTHSAHIIDTITANVFGVSNKSGRAEIAPLLTGFDKRRMCRELGYRPSDLLQSNCIIWVEGPSDRIYLNHWLAAKSPELVEGIHYALMFYGGKLLSHLSAEDSLLADFIGLLPINRHPAVLIDSDRTSDLQPLRATKTRVVAELNDVGGFSWVTQGREIENYVAADLRLEAIKNAHPSAVSLSSGPQRFAKQLDYLTDGGVRIKSNFDKVKIARFVATKPANFAILDLDTRIDDLIAFILSAN